MAITGENDREYIPDSDNNECFSAFDSKLTTAKRSELLLLLSGHSPHVVYVWREMEGSREFIDMMNSFTLIPIWKIALEGCSRD